MRHNGIMQKTLSLILLLVPVSVFAQKPTAAPVTTCNGDYALCAASNCKVVPGKTVIITTNGVITTYPATECVCPILKGKALASPGTGNMPAGLGCAPPVIKPVSTLPVKASKKSQTVWSLFSSRNDIPQAPDWKRNTPAKVQVCPALKNGMANCYSMACLRTGKASTGVDLATCICPLNENVNGKPIDIATTPVGTKSPDCDNTPVGAPVPTPSN